MAKGTEMAPAPIALFTYNRPDHLRRTLAALRENALARESRLYLFSDGPKGIEDAAAVEGVRRIVKHVEGFADVIVREQSTNQGLAQSVLSGVTGLVEQYGRIIVLEDDLVAAPGFLSFVNRALERYRDDPQVMQVSGYMFPVLEANRLSPTFFCRVPTSWGWGTWDRAWRRLDLDSGRMLNHLSDPRVREAFNVNGAYPYFEHLRLQHDGKLDVWGVRWYASMFVAGGLCLYPRRSLIQNIGMDGSGVHCGRSSDFQVELSPSRDWTYPDRIEESAEAVEAIRSFLVSLRAQKPESVIAELPSRLRAMAGRMMRAVGLANRSRTSGEKPCRR